MQKLDDGPGDFYGQHLAFAMPKVPMDEFCMITPPVVPLQEASQRTPGMWLSDSGLLVPNDAPGFGIERIREGIESALSSLISSSSALDCLPTSSPGHVLKPAGLFHAVI